MSNSYSAQVAPLLAANADKLVFELTAPANTTVKIKKIRIMHDDGTATVTSDYHKEVKLVLESVAGTGGSTYTPLDLDASATASACTVKTGTFTPGTISDTIDSLSIHNNTDFYWSAADEDDKIVLAPGGIFGIVINPAL